MKEPTKIEQEIYDYAKMCSVDIEGYDAIEQAVIYGMELALEDTEEAWKVLENFHNRKDSEK